MTKPSPVTGWLFLYRNAAGALLVRESAKSINQRSISLAPAYQGISVSDNPSMFDGTNWIALSVTPKKG
jgi:hypothetical protein